MIPDTLAQIHAASVAVFIPAFQEWVDQALRPEALTQDQVLIANARRLRDLEAGLPQGLENLGRFHKFVYATLIEDVGSTCRCPPQGMNLMPIDALYRQLTWLSPEADSFDFPFLPVERYLTLKEKVPLRLGETRPLVARVLGQLRDHPKILQQIVEDPRLLAPLELEVPHLESDSPSLCDEITVVRGWEWGWLSRRWRSPEVHESRQDLITVFLLVAVGGRGDGLWVDLGSGDGITLANLALDWSGMHFIGVDVASVDPHAVQEELETGARHLMGLPSNVDYCLVTQSPIRSPYVRDLIVPEGRMGRPVPDLVREMIVKEIGEKKADVVSIIYPPSQEGNGPDAVLAMLASGLELLRPGGGGFLLTENPSVLARALQFLSADRRVDFVHYATRPLNQKRLRHLGIEPYRPFSMEMKTGEIRHEDRFRRHGRFTWAYPVVFRMK